MLMKSVKYWEDYQNVICRHKVNKCWKIVPTNLLEVGLPQNFNLLKTKKQQNPIISEISIKIGTVEWGMLVMRIKFYVVSDKIISTTSHESTKEFTKRRAIEF